MNDTIDAGAENQVARYATAVRAAFADLPGPDRELLLEDLEDHLQEVAAEAGVPMEDLEGHHQPAPDQPVGEGEPRSRVPEAEPPPADDDRDARERP